MCCAGKLLRADEENEEIREQLVQAMMARSDDNKVVVASEDQLEVMMDDRVVELQMQVVALEDQSEAMQAQLTTQVICTEARVIDLEEELKTLVFNNKALMCNGQCNMSGPRAVLVFETVSLSVCLSVSASQPLPLSLWLCR